MNDHQRIKLYATHPHDCSYFDDREARTVFIDPDVPLTPRLYTELSQRGFRRSGNHVYRPQCESCRECIATRIPVANFEFSRSQRRVLKRNADITVKALSRPAVEAYDLYERYINGRHDDGDMYPASRNQYDSFIAEAPGYTEFRHFYLGDVLVGLAVTDVLNDGLSAIYTFYDPDLSRRSLGRFSILDQIRACRERRLPYLYLGYWIRDSEKMRYKTDYRPIELLVKNRWLGIT